MLALFFLRNAELSSEVMQSYKENARIAQELAAKVSEITVLREETEKNREEVEKLTSARSLRLRPHTHTVGASARG